jgi:dTDP-4-amino-4,6-dideoxygalactose transaminase
MKEYRVPFNRPYHTGREFNYLQEAIDNKHLSGNGPFTKRCSGLLCRQLGVERVLLTHSATAALEMAALLIDLAPGDEVIMPSFTFVSTANAVALRRATPVFVDVRADTLNLDASLLEEAVTSRTRAIVPVHYAGVACEMDAIKRLAHDKSLVIIEDAAQGVGARYRGTPLGSLGDLAALSFHETKNAISGEGGALVVSNMDYASRAEIIWEKGTDRSRFFRGEVDKYTWQDLGSSFLPSDLLAAFLLAQLEAVEWITRERVKTWQLYQEALEPLEASGRLRRPVVPEDCTPNGHLYHVLLDSRDRRDKTLSRLAEVGIQALFHYVPLHLTPAGQRFGRPAGALPVTESVAGRLLRLPMWVGLAEPDVAYVADQLAAILN